MKTLNTIRAGILATAAAACVIVAASGTVAFGEQYGATGPGIAIKGGAMTCDNPIDPPGDREETTRGRIDVEICTNMFADDHIDFAVSLGGSYFGTDRYRDSGTTATYSYDDHFKDQFSVVDTRVMARLYPLGSESVIRPYFGGGLGYFWLIDSWHDDYYTTYNDTHHTHHDEDSDSDTLAEGIFPFLCVGITVPFAHHFELMVEGMYDFNKDDNNYDLSGPIYTFGARFRF
jgi:hypothetical protein